MSQQGLGAVMDRFTNDSTFRAEMKQDPEGAISRGGFELSEQEKEAVRNLDWSQPDEHLKQRISKAVA
jgi:hypothetical protein